MKAWKTEFSCGVRARTCPYEASAARSNANWAAVWFCGFWLLGVELGFGVVEPVEPDEILPESEPEASSEADAAEESEPVAGSTLLSGLCSAKSLPNTAGELPRPWHMLVSSSASDPKLK